MLRRFVLLAAASLFCVLGHAQSSSLKADSVTPATANPPAGEDVDTVITNGRMRAETGSKSRYSISTAFGYSAGSLKSPLSERRPNLSEATGYTDVAALNGSIAGKYSFTTQQSAFAGVGVRWVTPFAGPAVPAGYNGDKFDADNPYLMYQYLYRWAGVQSSFQVQETFFTASNLVRDGYVTTWGVSQNNVYDLGDSGFTVGLNAYVGLGYFDKNTEKARLNQSDYSFGASPSLEYRMSDRFSLHTDANLFIYQHLRSERGAYTFDRQKVVQSLSLGALVTRDIFVSPGVQFDPLNLRADRTTTWVSANINLF
jgi:hypothetical protein